MVEMEIGNAIMAPRVTAEDWIDKMDFRYVESCADITELQTMLDLLL